MITRTLSKKHKILKNHSEKSKQQKKECIEREGREKKKSLNINTIANKFSFNLIFEIIINCTLLI